MIVQKQNILANKQVNINFTRLSVSAPKTSFVDDAVNTERLNSQGRQRESPIKIVENDACTNIRFDPIGLQVNKHIVIKGIP